MENSYEVSNTIEGPKLKEVVHILQEDYIKQWETAKDPYAMAIDSVIAQLPQGDLKEALMAGKKERDARTAAKKDYFDPVMTEEAKKYAFRGIKRKSDNSPTYLSKDSTLNSVDPNLHKYGSESPGTTSGGNIMSGMMWDTFTFPNPSALKNEGVDISFILVYKNEPYVLPTKPGDTNTSLFIPRNSESRETIKEISINEAKEKGYPTLRDLFIGEVEIHFDKKKGILQSLFNSVK